MNQETKGIACILMASGMSVRYGKNKLLEKLGGREVILHTADHLREAGLEPLGVTRNPIVQALLAREGIRCVMHSGPKKSDTIHTGMEHSDPDAGGYLFMPGDQPLVRPASLREMAGRFRAGQGEAVRLGYRETPGSPVLFPRSLREKLMAYEGERGGAEVLRRERIPCILVQARDEWELWDADTPESMERIRTAYARLAGHGV